MPRRAAADHLDAARFRYGVAKPGVCGGRLTRGLAAGDLLMLHDGSAARTAQGAPVVLAVLPLLLNALAEYRLTAVSLEAVADD